MLNALPRLLFPLLINLLLWILAVISHLPLNMEAAQFWPDLLILYVICVNQLSPSHIFTISCVLVGAFKDIAAGNIIGVSSMEFMLISFFIDYKRKFFTHHSFAFTWGIVVGIIFVCAIVKSLISYMLTSNWLIGYVTIPEIIVTALAYPLIFRLFNILSKIGCDA